MRANELRIGNYLERKTSINTWDEFKVRPIDIYRLSEGASWLIEHRPIPLTEEWLVKFGFTIKNYGYLCKNKRIYISNSNDDFEYSCSYFDCDEYIEIKHVHTLQNLYFALTNEEL